MPFSVWMKNAFRALPKRFCYDEKHACETKIIQNHFHSISFKVIFSRSLCTKWKLEIYRATLSSIIFTIQLLMQPTSEMVIGDGSTRSANTEGTNDLNLILSREHRDLNKWCIATLLLLLTREYY